MGSVAAAYGPLLPYFIGRFHLTVSSAGLVFGLHFVGALIGVLIALVALPRFPSRLVVTIGLALLAIGCAGVALAGTWTMTLAAVFLIGFGFGGLDLTVNQMLAYSANSSRLALINSLNGVFGVGAVVAPLLIAAAASRYPPLYFGGAVIALLAMIGFRGIRGSLSVATGSSEVATGLLLIAIFALAFSLYVGIEIGVSGWMATDLYGHGYSLAQAAGITSGFWLALALGRFLLAPFVGRLGDGTVVLLASAAAIVTLLLAMIPGIAPIAYVLTGLIIAPIFPTGVAWLARLNPANPTATSWLFPAGMVGGAVIPTLVGVLIARAGIGWIAPSFALVALLTTAAFASAGRLVAPEFPPPPSGGGPG
jgi:MFS transporter, FHS family, glucose/mannose:H+ symporter